MEASQCHKFQSKGTQILPLGIYVSTQVTMRFFGEGYWANLHWGCLDDCLHVVAFSPEFNILICRKAFSLNFKKNSYFFTSLRGLGRSLSYVLIICIYMYACNFLKWSKNVSGCQNDIFHLFHFWCDNTLKQYHHIIHWRHLQHIVNYAW